MAVGANHFGFDGSGKQFFIEGMEFGQSRVLGDAEPFISAGRPFDVEVTRNGTAFSFRVDGKEVHQGTYTLGPVSAIGFRPWRATMRVREFSAEGDLLPLSDAAIVAMQQDHNWCPTVLPNGRVLYLRWEYSGIPHGASRILFHMNPDGTKQSAYYGSNSHWPKFLHPWPLSDKYFLVACKPTPSSLW